MSRRPQPAGWIGDPTVSWQILLTAHLHGTAPAVGAIEPRLAALAGRHSWPRPAEVVATDDDAALADRRHEAADRTDGAPVRVVRTPTAVVLAAHHAYVDGLGLLALLGAVLDVEVSSSARGLGDRARPSGRPGAVLAARRADLPRLLRRSPAPAATALAERTAAGPISTAALVHAAAEAHRRTTGAPPRTVAVGASRRSGERLDAAEVVDRSAFLRLVGPDWSADDVRAALRRLPPEPGADRRPGPVGAALARWAGTRLGSDLVVSHLGRVTAPGCRRLVFHPAAGGPAALAIGAVSLGSPGDPPTSPSAGPSMQTVVTARYGRAGDAERADRCLDSVVEALAARR